MLGRSAEKELLINVEAKGRELTSLIELIFEHQNWIKLYL
jgi:hypothetical protein